MLDQDEINLVLDKPWAADGKHFSERIWGDRRAELVQELNKSLRKMLVTGENPVKLAPEIKKKFNVSERQAERLLRTEDAYFAEEATYNSYKECGTEEYEIIATLDYKTSEICRDMDGKHFPVENKKTGVNYPPFHPNCRTTTAPYIDDPELTEGDTRIARDSKGKNYYVPANMTYKEWYESLDSEERAAFVKLKKQDRKKKVDKSAESGIIKNIDVDDLDLAIYGKDVDEEAVKIIKKHFVDNSLADGYYINNISMKSIQIEEENEKEKGRPLIQTIAKKRGNMYETDIVLNEDIFKGCSIEVLNKKLKNYKNNIAQTFEEAVIHEVGHAKTIFSNRFRDIETMYKKLEKMGVDGISVIALNDGAEAVAEIEILLHRGSVIPKQAKDLYDNVMSGNFEI